jgi:actin-related protein
MSAIPSYLDRKNIGGARSNIPQAQGTPASPHTPRRNPPSTFSSPGAGYRLDDEVIVLEIGARHVDAGFAGESYPKCTFRFSREDSRRIGDYRRWLPGFSTSSTAPTKSSTWGQENELWRTDLQDVDLGLVEDKLERAVRDSYSRALLQDAKSRRMVVVLPSLLPQALLASIISLLFRNFLVPELALLSTPSVSVLGAGKRSGLVVDIGWRETTVTAVYEFREIKHGKTTRAMRRVTLAMAQLIDQASKEQPIDLSEDGGEDALVHQDFEFSEDVTARLAWCRETAKKDGSDDLANVVRLPKGPGDLETMEVHFEDFSLPVESTLFPDTASQRTLDDEEHTIHHLIYEVLTSITQDARATCSSNIMFTGGGSHVPGLKTRLMTELMHLVKTRGWDPIWGGAANRHRERLKEIDRNRQARAASDIEKTGEIDSDDDGDRYEGPPAFVETVEDPISKKLREEAAKLKIDQPAGEIRCIESLGPWAGASLAASLKIKGVVEIEREAFLQHGMAGAHKEYETNTTSTKSRQSMGPNLARPSAPDSSAWTLGLWEA